jgi:thermostable 8-oxoguanine DNA glycosylase
MTISTDDLEPNDGNFDYLPQITLMLDSYDGDFDQIIVNKIVLWKVNRYPIIDDAILQELNVIKKTDQSFSPVPVRSLLLKLLSCHGIQLPMASTILRFKNPKLFQIIDQRVYRIIYGKKLKLPGYYNINNREKLADLYLKYLQDLRNTCDELKIPFEKADRILWMADKRINKDKPLDNY